MKELVDFLKGFVGAVAVSAIVGVVAGLAVRLNVWLGLVVTLAYLIAYMLVTVRVFGQKRTWVGFGLVVALLLALPAFTTACFVTGDADDEPSPSVRPRPSMGTSPYGL